MSRRIIPTVNILLKLFVLTSKGFPAEKGDAIRYNYAYYARWSVCPTGFLYFGKENSMETRVALIGIVVENLDSVDKLNSLLHDYGKYIIGRMGVPYEKKGVSIISVALDATQDVISALSGKLGAIDGVTAKTIYSKLGDAK